MSIYTDRVENHECTQNLKLIVEKINEIFEMNKDNLTNADYFEHFDRIQSIIKQLEIAYFETNQYFIHKAFLNNLNNQLNSLLSHLNSFSQNCENIQSLIESNQVIDNIIPFLSQLYNFDSKSKLKELQTNISNVKKSVTANFNFMTQQFNEFEVLRTSFHNSVSELKNEIDKTKQDNNNLLTDFQNKFLSSQEKRSEDFLSEKELRKSNFENLINSFKDNSEEIINNSINDLKEKEKEAAKIVGAISQTGMSGGFKLEAKNQAKKAFNWHLITIVPSIFLIILGINTFNDFSDNNFSWISLVGRMSLSLILISAITYTAKRANYHHDLEKENKDKELVSAALNPFIETLKNGTNDSKLDELKEQVIKDIFKIREKSDESDKALKEPYNLAKVVLSEVKEILKISQK